MSQTLTQFESQTKEIAHMIKSLPENIKDFFFNIQKELPNYIFSGITDDANPVLLLGFIRYFNELSLQSAFPGIDFLLFEEELLIKIQEKFKNKSILIVCQEVKDICENKLLSLPMLDVKVTYCRRGFGQRINLIPNTDTESMSILPSKKSNIEKLVLPARFSQHLIQN